MSARRQLLFACAMVVSATARAQQIGEPVDRLSIDGLQFMDIFGDSVALSGSRLVVSALAHSPRGLIAFYRREGVGWRLEGTFEPDVCFPPGHPNYGCRLGYDVSLLGDRALAGARAGDYVQGTGGACFVFEHGDNGWNLTQQIRAPQTPGGNVGFGGSVAQNDRTLAVGAHEYPNGSTQQGAVFRYEFIGGLWTLTQTVFAPPTGSFGVGWFGWSIDMTNDLLVVGEPMPYGRVHVYEERGNQWELKASLYKPGPIDPHDYFGSAVAIDPDTLTIVIGAPTTTFASFRPGQAHVFEYDDATQGWLWAALLQPEGPVVSSSNYNDLFGSAVGASAGQVIVGGAREIYLGRMQGSAELFEKVEGSWQLIRRYALDNPAPHVGGLGAAVDLEAGTTIVAAPSWPTDIDGTGTVFVYEESLGTEICAATSNSTGVPADLVLLGSTAATSHDLSFAVHHAPPGGLGQVAMGQPSPGVPFGAGVLCLQAPVRMASETVVISPAGTAYVSLGPLDPVDSSIWIPGSTWSFQLLYRDLGSAPVPLANTTNAYSITFQ